MSHSQMIGAVVLAFMVSNLTSFVGILMSRGEAASLRAELQAIRRELADLRRTAEASGNATEHSARVQETVGIAR